jgi:hypothetical protein
MTPNSDTIDFYEAIRLMENSTKRFSVAWCQYSMQTGKGGSVHSENNVLFEGKRQTEDYELIFFKTISGQLLCCHLFSLMFFNGKKMVIS